MAEEISQRELLYLAAKQEDWTRCRDLVNGGVNTAYSDQDGSNAFRLAVEKDQTELLRLMLEKDPHVFSRNAEFVEKQIWEQISDRYFFTRANSSRFMLLKTLLTGNPVTSDLIGSFHLFCKQLQLATDCFYDRMTPIPPMHILFVCCIETLATYDNASMASTILLCIHRNDLQGEDFVHIVSLLVAHTNVQMSRCIDTIVLLFRRHISLQFVFDLLQVIVLAHDSFEREGQWYLEHSVACVASELLCQLEDCSEDLRSRLAAILAGLEYKNKLLVEVILYCRPDKPALLEIVQFLVDMCHCDPNYKDKYRNGDFFLPSFIDSYCDRLELELAVRFLLDRGAHPCVRNKNGIPAFNLFPSVGLPAIGVRTLRCIAASKVVEEKIKYGKEDLPKEMHELLELH